MNWSSDGWGINSLEPKIGWDLGLKDTSAIATIKDNKILALDQLKPIKLNLFVPCEVEGDAVGDLMVYCWQGSFYVAHIPTATRFDKAVLDCEWSRNGLIAWCHKVQQEKRLYWSKLAQATDATYNDQEFDDAKEKIKEYCLEVI